MLYALRGLRGQVDHSSHGLEHESPEALPHAFNEAHHALFVGPVKRLFDDPHEPLPESFQQRGEALLEPFQCVLGPLLAPVLGLALNLAGDVLDAGPDRACELADDPENPADSVADH